MYILYFTNNKGWGFVVFSHSQPDLTHLSLSLSLSHTHTHTHTRTHARTPLMFYLLPQEGNRVHNPDNGISSFWSPSCAQLNSCNSHSQEWCQTSFST